MSRRGADVFDEDTAVMICGHVGWFWSNGWKACVACASIEEALASIGPCVVCDYPTSLCRQCRACEDCCVCDYDPWRCDERGAEAG